MRRRIGNLLVESRRNPGTASIAAGLVLALAVTPALFAPGLYDDFTLAKQASLLVAAALVAFGLAWDGEPWPRRRLVRHLLWAWIALLAVSFWSGLDTRGSVLGYYQYRQGLLSQVSYVVLFLGALKLSRSDGIRWLPLTGAVGLAAATAYTAVQSLGRDPVDWWIDTSARAIGTIGNANELAAYGVLAVAFAAAGVTASSRRAIALAIAVAACSGFVILQSESRSGLIALAILVAIFPVAAAIVRQGKRRAMRGWLTLVTGLALGGLAGIVVGGAGGTASRIQSGMAAPEADGSTRIELWKGTVHTIAASPLVGFGPDGLHLAFPRHRPDGLGGAFIHYDLVAQSSHNLALDIAANEGIPALAVIVALFATVGVGSLRRERANPGDGWAPLTWAAMAGYVALTMVNPVSLAPHALFFILLGVLEGRSEQELPVRAPPALSRPARVAFASPWLLALGGMAVLLPIADLHANRAWAHYSRGEFEQAAGEYQSASSLLPFERTYAASVAGSWLAAGVDGGPPALQQAVRAYESLDRDFGFTSGEAIGLATARIGLGTTAGVERLLDRSVRLNPHGLTTEAYTAQLRLAAAEGGTLLYAARDHWVRVVPNTERAGR